MGEEAEEETEQEDVGQGQLVDQLICLEIGELREKKAGEMENKIMGEMLTINAPVEV